MLFRSLLSCFAFIGSVTCCPLPGSPVGLTKRWYSIRAGSYGFGTWPVTHIDLNSGRRRQPLRYCYRDENSLQTLKPLLDEALARWAPAFEGSSLSIEPDKRAGVSQLCNNILWPDRDALIIGEGCKGCWPGTTVGYDWYNLDTPGRHKLDFHDAEVLRTAEPGTRAKWVADMMHELGHAMGLGHEHQRPDRGRYIRFNCSKVVGYEVERESISKMPAHSFPGDMTTDQRMEMVCTQRNLAQLYFPALLEFLPFVETAGHFINGPTFDYDSMMIYSSSEQPGMPERKLGDERDWVIYGYEGQHAQRKFPIWQGGSYDFAKRKPSPKDAERIRMLYPLYAGKSGEELLADYCAALYSGKHCPGWPKGQSV